MIGGAIPTTRASRKIHEVKSRRVAHGLASTMVSRFSRFVFWGGETVRENDKIKVAKKTGHSSNNHTQVGRLRSVSEEAWSVFLNRTIEARL